uniref:Protein ApaG n=1 Tax=Cannabis sativa TaxID=3483 RepID=A0A803PA80_CANSA
MHSLSLKVFADFNGKVTAARCMPSGRGRYGVSGLDFRTRRSQTYALLKQKMEVAAKSEDYEEAARIRDSLKLFEEEEPVLRLRRLIKEAVVDERFEDAANYRDELREIAPHSLLKCSSDATTLGIRVQVRSVYIEGRSQPSKGRYFFAYRIRITNNSERPVQLLRRHWIITDAHGKTENVWGTGVIGEQPVILPQTSFEYSSACPLCTANGRMFCLSFLVGGVGLYLFLFGSLSSCCGVGCLGAFMEVVKADNRGKCLSFNEATVELAPCASSVHALTSLCLFGKVVAPSGEGLSWMKITQPAGRTDGVPFPLFGPWLVSTSTYKDCFSGNSKQVDHGLTRRVLRLSSPTKVEAKVVSLCEKSLGHSQAGDTSSKGLFSRRPKMVTGGPRAMGGKHCKAIWIPKIFEATPRVGDAISVNVSSKRFDVHGKGTAHVPTLDGDNLNLGGCSRVSGEGPEEGASGCVGGGSGPLMLKVGRVGPAGVFLTNSGGPKGCDPKLSFGDIGAQPVSKKNERTTRLKKRKLVDGLTSACYRLVKMMRQHPGVVPDFPWDIVGPNHDDEVTSQSTNDLFGLSWGFRLLAKMRSLDKNGGNLVLLEDFGSRVSDHSTPVKEDDVPPPQEP